MSLQRITYGRPRQFRICISVLFAQKIKVSFYRNYQKDPDSARSNSSDDLDLLKLEAKMKRNDGHNHKKESHGNRKINSQYQDDPIDKMADVRFLSKQKAKIHHIEGEVIFGNHPVFLALKQRQRSAHKLYVSDKLDPAKNKIVQDIFDLAKEHKVPMKIVPKRYLNNLSAGRPNQGSCLDVSIKEYKNFDNANILRCISTEKTWLVLDKILDPMNLGAIIRSSYFFGVDKLFVVKGSCRLSPVVSKASSGTMELLDIYSIDDLVTFIKECQGFGWNVLATASKDPFSQQSESVSVPVDKVQPQKNNVLIFGNEGDGLSEEVLSLCHQHIYIPPHPGVEENLLSLNVSVSAAIILHNLTRNCA